MAVNVRFYEEGTVNCGDTMLIIFPDGTKVYAPALDAGPFDGYYIADHPDLPIIVDVPKHLWYLNGREGLSSKVTMINFTRLMEVFERMVEQ